MNILHINLVDCNVSGAQRVTISVLELLTKKYNLVTFTSNSSSPMHRALARFKPYYFSNKLLFELGNLSSGGLALSNALKYLQFIFFTAALNIFTMLTAIRHKSDLVYFVDPRGLLSNILLVLSGRRAIFHLHGSLKLPRIISFLINLHNNMTVIVPSESCRDSVKGLRCKVVVVYNGVFDDFCDLGCLPDSHGPVKLAYAGVLSPQKGILNLLKSLREASFEYSLDVLGEFFGEFHLFKDEVVREAGLNQSVTLKGWCADIDYQLYDFLIFPAGFHSEFFINDKRYLYHSSEALPTVIIESIGAGTPVLSLRNYGVEEIITDDVYGVVFDDLKSLVRFIPKLPRWRIKCEDLASFRERFSRAQFEQGVIKVVEAIR